MQSQKCLTSFDVWSFTLGDEESWTYQKTTSDHDEALAEAKRIGKGSTVSAIYERGRFQADGREVIRDVMFWWSENGYSEMEGAPWGRGRGWSDDYGMEVAYDPLNSGDLTPQYQIPTLQTYLPLPVSASEPEYVTVSCARCGCIIPMNRSRQYSSKYAVGSTSGTYRSSNSTTIRHGSRSSSTSYRHGSSSSSGRTYYKHETVTLCRPCYRSQVRSDRFKFTAKALAALLIIYLWMHYIGK